MKKMFNSIGMIFLASLLLGIATTAYASDPPPLRVVTDSNPNFSGVWVDTTNNELIVSDDNHHQILVYARTASGNATPLRTIAGLATGIDFPSTVVLDTKNAEIWLVDNDTSDRAEVFSRTANGNVTPLRIIDFKALELTEKRTWGWFVDAVNDEVWGTFQNGSTVDVFNRLDGDILRRIRGTATGLADPHGVYVDTLNNEVFVVNEGHIFGAPPQAPSVTIYPRTASGNVAPLRTIQGSSTGLAAPKAVFVDTTNNELAVVNGSANSVTIFSRTANGNVAPLRTVSGAITGLSNPTGVYIDAVNNELIVTNWGNHTLTVYTRTANGNVKPLRTLTAGAGGVVSGFGNPGALFYDATNLEFAVTNCVSHPRIAIFDRLANGQVAPKRVIEGSNTRYSRSGHGVVIDSVNDELFAPSTLEDAILVFNRLDSGNVAPKRVIQGAATGIDKPQGIALDTTNNEIAIANNGTATTPPTITIYGRLASGNVAPLRTISGASTGLNKPVGIWIDVVNNEIVVGDGANNLDAVRVYPRTANGNVAPLRTITGSSTMLNKTRQVIVDTTNNEIYAANLGDREVNPPVFGNVAVFDRLANGNVAPKRFLQQVTNSFVEHPRSIWLNLADNELGVGDSKLNEVRVFDRLFGTSATATPSTSFLAPTGLTATAGKATITLNWNKSAGATSYNVKRSRVSGGPYTIIATGVTATTFSSTNLTSGTTYCYVVSAVNAARESPNSNEACATAK